MREACPGPDRPRGTSAGPRAPGVAKSGIEPELCGRSGGSGSGAEFSGFADEVSVGSSSGCGMRLRYTRSTRPVSSSTGSTSAPFSMPNVPKLPSGRKKRASPREIVARSGPASSLPRAPRGGHVDLGGNAGRFVFAAADDALVDSRAAQQFGSAGLPGSRFETRYSSPFVDAFAVHGASRLTPLADILP